MLRVLLNILFLPVLFVIRAAIFVLVILNALSTGLLSIASSLLGILSGLVFLTVSTQSGVMLLVIAVLISPIGLPFLAEKLLYLLDDLCGAVQSLIRV